MQLVCTAFASSFTHDVIIPVFIEAQYFFNFFFLALQLLYPEKQVFGDEEIMNRLTEETIKQATVGKMMTCQEVSSYSPQEIREAISGLVAEHKTILAEALVEAGLALYPESEDILAIASLMAMQRQDWGQAASLLRSLIDQQGVNATPCSYTLC